MNKLGIDPDKYKNFDENPEDYSFVLINPSHEFQLQSGDIIYLLKPGTAPKTRALDEMARNLDENILQTTNLLESYAKTILISSNSDGNLNCDPNNNINIKDDRKKSASERHIKLDLEPHFNNDDNQDSMSAPNDNRLSRLSMSSSFRKMKSFLSNVGSNLSASASSSNQQHQHQHGKRKKHNKLKSENSSSVMETISDSKMMANNNTSYTMDNEASASTLSTSSAAKRLNDALFQLNDKLSPDSLTLTTKI